MPVIFFNVRFWLLIPLLFGLLFHQEAAAQKFRDNAVFLRNGTIIRGRIIENDSINGLRISNNCGIWYFAPAEVDSIGTLLAEKTFSGKDKGYINISRIGLLFGYENHPVPSVSMVHGFKFNPGAMAGLGVGYEYFDWSVLPVFAEGRYFINKQGFSPFVFGQAGYSITLDRKPENYWGNSTERSFGGPMVSAGAGIRAGISGNSAFVFSIAYRFQKLTYSANNSWESDVQRNVIKHYNRVAFNIGFLFE